MQIIVKLFQLVGRYCIFSKKSVLKISAKQVISLFIRLDVVRLNVTLDVVKFPRLSV